MRQLLQPIAPFVYCRLSNIFDVTSPRVYDAMLHLDVYPWSTHTKQLHVRLTTPLPPPQTSSGVTQEALGWIRFYLTTMSLAPADLWK